MREGMGAMPVPFCYVRRNSKMFDGMYNRNPVYGYGQPTPPTSYAMGMYNRPASGNQITWVMGIENAKTFPIAPNTTVLLMFMLAVMRL